MTSAVETLRRGDVIGGGLATYVVLDSHRDDDRWFVSWITAHRGRVSGPWRSSFALGVSFVAEDSPDAGFVRRGEP